MTLTYVQMLQNIINKYGENADETGYFHYVFARRERETVEYVYNQLMKRA